MTIPRRCELVYQALQGLLGQTDFSARTGCWRYIDLIKITGRNSTERKLRELIEAEPGLVRCQVLTGEDGTRFKVFDLAPQTKIQGGLEIQSVTRINPTTLFDLQSLGRPE